MNAALLVELAREWFNLAQMAQRSSMSIGAVTVDGSLVPLELARQALAIARSALELSARLDEFARAHAEASRRD